MANVVRSPVFVLDTANSTLDLVSNTLFHPLAIRWTNMAVNANVELADATGNVVWKASAPAANSTIESRPQVHWRGLIVKVLGSGIVQIETYG